MLTALLQRQRSVARIPTPGCSVPQGIDTSFLVATLTAAIQEQQALITSLTARIAALEGATQ